MKPYGVSVIEAPDVADIWEMGSKSRTGCLSGRSGHYRGYIRNKAAKAAIRRGWARKARREGRAACSEE